MLHGALEVHSFTSDTNELLARINERRTLLVVDDTGKDLRAVEALRRKVDSVGLDVQVWLCSLVCVQLIPSH